MTQDPGDDETAAKHDGDGAEPEQGQAQAQPHPPRSRLYTILATTASFLVSQWSLLTLALLVVLAYHFPNVGRAGGYIHAEYTVAWGAVALIFLIAGLSLDIKTLLRGIPHWRAHIVTQGFSFLLVPALMFGLACAGRDAHLDMYVLAGMVVTGCMPTTIATNVTCTLAAGGSTELASIEVVLGNVLGTFVTPLLVRMFLGSAKGWSAAAPGGTDGMQAIYVRMAKQLSATLIAPLFVGLVLQYKFPTRVARVRTRLHLGKVATLMTTLGVWENFSNAFAAGTFETVSHTTTVYLCLTAWGAYVLLTALVLAVARLPGLHTRLASVWRFTKRDTIALCFCCPAKGIAVGAPLLAILYADTPLSTLAKIALALVIYNGEQVATAQLVVPALRRWARDEVEAESGVDCDAKDGAAAGSRSSAVVVAVADADREKHEAPWNNT